MDVAELERAARALIASDRVTPPTRRALLARLDAPAGEGLFSPGQRRTLQAVAARLLPAGELLPRLHLAARFEAELAQGRSDGWRYADMPPDAAAQAGGLDGLDSAARSVHGRAFAELEGAEQDALLAAVQRGAPPGAPWPFSAARWFEDLLAALVQLAYGHPLLQVAIGFDGFADAHGQPPSA